MFFYIINGNTFDICTCDISFIDSILLMDLSFSMLVLLDYSDIREERQEYFEELIQVLNNYLLKMRLEDDGLAFLEYLSSFSVQELMRYEKLI